ncbi:hypothetical protein VTI74DRAFT_852 [Chaetomium olivicolor]
MLYSTCNNSPAIAPFPAVVAVRRGPTWPRVAAMRVTLKISVVLWAIALVTASGYVLSRLLVFKQIFFQHAGIPVTQQQAADEYENGGDKRIQHIPKIVHQVFHNWKDPGNDTLPADWVAVRQNCMDLNPSFEFKLWTEEASRDFIEKEYAWFLRTYDGYRHKVQRVDAVRYFLLLHYGGIYMDLDNGCKRDLTPTLYYPTWITEPGRGALSNNILASRPNHPFWARLTHSLMPYDWNWFFPYVTISYASGQWFVTAIWQEYHRLLPKPSDNPKLEHRLHLLMMDDRPGAHPSIFFTQERGGTWINWDNLLFLWIGDHLFLFLLMLFGGIGFVFCAGSRLLRKHRNGYVRLKNVKGRSVA